METMGGQFRQLFNQLPIKESRNASSKCWQIVLWRSLLIQIVHIELSNVCPGKYYCNVQYAGQTSHLNGLREGDDTGASHV